MLASNVRSFLHGSMMKSFAFFFNCVLLSVLLVDYTRQIENKYARVGETVLFSCNFGKYGGERSILLSWIRDINTTTSIPLTFSTHVLTLDKRIGVDYDEIKRDYSLQIMRVKQEDSGIYFCAFNSTPNVEPEKIRFYVNKFDTSPIILNLTKGDNVNLTCFEEVEPTPEIVWKRSENRSLPNGDTTYIGPSLNFTVIKHDRGEFSCTTKDEDGKVFTKKITVNVDFAPEIYVKDTRQIANLGTLLELECIVDALPKPSISWTFNGTAVDGKKPFHTQHYEFGLYSTSTVLRIASFQTEYYGQYVCRANNSLGTGESMIQVQSIAIQNWIE